MSRTRTRTQSLQSSHAGGKSIGTRPTSPTFSVTTHASDLRELTGRAERIITRADLRASADAYEQLLGASASFRDALGSVSRASAGLAEAIEKCSRLKGPSDECGKDLQAAAGMHHLISNHERLLEHTILHKFEAPLKQGFEAYKTSVATRTSDYEHALTEKSRLIRKTEAENMRVGRRKLRDLNSFRAALATLQNQVNDLDKLKSDYYTQVLEHEQRIWDGVLGGVAIVVRSTMDVYDRITAKASDPSLEHILASVPDPFDEYANVDPSSTSAIFSILPPLDILTGTKTPTGDSTAPGSASSSAGTAPIPPSTSTSASVGGLNGAPSGNGLKTWLETQSDWTEPGQAAGASRRYSHPPVGGAAPGGASYPASQSQHFPYTAVASSPLASPPILGVISEAHGYGEHNNSGAQTGYRGGGGYGSRESSVERAASPGASDGGWAAYAFPARPLRVDEGMSEAALDGATPVATRFSLPRNDSGNSGSTAGVGGEEKADDTESESAVTVVAASGNQGGDPPR
ncbi:hypothetical protein BDV93DRAFT_485152 [Ceratobasidium sp. AG-I]|nr:hypothetical protein BDV93DRAFT_485152 [Ceratobasidium sp. AG-I]